MSGPTLTLAEAATAYAEAVKADWAAANVLSAVEYRSAAWHQASKAWWAAVDHRSAARHALERAALVANGVEP